MGVTINTLIVYPHSLLITYNFKFLNYPYLNTILLKLTLIKYINVYLFTLHIINYLYFYLSYN